METKINSFAQQVKREIVVEPDKNYPLLGLRLYGNGLFLRETKKGREISSKKLFQVKGGDFVYSRLFGWRGSFAIVPKELDNSYVSGEFPIFKIDESIIKKEYLLECFLTEKTLREVEKSCIGRTKGSRNRFKEEKFLSMSINIPTIEHQVSFLKSIHTLREIQRKISDAESVSKSLRESLIWEEFGD